MHPASRVPGSWFLHHADVVFSHSPVRSITRPRKSSSLPDRLLSGPSTWLCCNGFSKAAEKKCTPLPNIQFLLICTKILQTRTNILIVFWENIYSTDRLHYEKHYYRVATWSLLASHPSKPFKSLLQLITNCNQSPHHKLDFHPAFRL